MSDVRNNNPEEKSVLHNWLESLPEGKREKFLKVVGDDELMTLAGSEDEFRLVTGREIPFRHALDKPLSPDEIATPHVTEEMLNERLEQIMKAFPKPTSTAELREKMDEDLKPENSLEDLREKAQPSLKIQISIEQLKEMSNKV